MAVAHDEATMELIKTRLSHSERPLIRLVRTFYKLSMIPAAGSQESEEGRGAIEEELQIVHMSFILELRQLIKTLKELKGTRAVELNRSESRQLEIERNRLEEQARQEKLKILNLESQLDQARRDRRNKIQYEEIGKEVRRFSDRFQSADRINGLAREIESLLEEQGFYAERWASRRAQFDTVISNLEVLQESIKEEKADADRKKALNDDESDDGNIGEEGGESAGGTKSGRVEEAEPSDRGEGKPETDGPEMPKGLNPQAASFQPPSAGGGDQPRPTTERSDDRMKIDEGPHARTPRPPSELDIKTGELQPMDIDGFEPKTGLSHGSSAEDGLVIEEATMEDGEEIEEAEEGEEMEHQA
ncbi:hypothetical protein PtB15_9B233 [Puccinia triticina]|nr:hypothetical protein PtB15_9B233 [Puccinia triticina]